jgi:hypothetical protein
MAYTLGGDTFNQQANIINLGPERQYCAQLVGGVLRCSGQSVQAERIARVWR